MNTAICSIATGDHQRIADITWPVMRDWCDRHDIYHELSTSVLDDRRNPSWNKILHVRDLLKGFDRVIWFDADVLILDLDRSPDDVFPKQRMGVSADFNGACLGCFSMSHCDWSFALLNTLWFLGQTKTVKPWDSRDTWEQNTFKALMWNFQSVDDMVMLLNPRTAIANRDINLTENNAFAYHAWANQGVDVIVDVLNKMRNEQAA